MEIKTLDQHVEENHAVATAPGATLKVVYAIARPILSAVSAFLFFNPKWSEIITALIAGMDSLTSAPVVA